MKNTAWYDSEEARKVKNKEQNQEVKDMYTTERKEAMHSQVAELHQQKSSVINNKQYSESKSSSQQIVTSSSSSQQQQQHQESSSSIQQQQQQHTSSSTSYQQQSSEEQMTEWQKVAMKEKKHVQYAQESHFSKVRWTQLSYNIFYYYEYQIRKI